MRIDDFEAWMVEADALAKELRTDDD